MVVACTYVYNMYMRIKVCQCACVCMCACVCSMWELSQNNLMLGNRSPIHVHETKSELHSSLFSYKRAALHSPL